MLYKQEMVYKSIFNVRCFFHLHSYDMLFSQN